MAIISPLTVIAQTETQTKTFTTVTAEELPSEDLQTTHSIDGYHIRRNTSESLRLTVQHHFLVERQGWLLHPDIHTSISHVENPQILDVATGTAIWAIDTARQYPNATVTASDISNEQFPQPWTTPSNLQLSILDLLQDIPSHLQGKFDVVHCRLLLAAGPDVDKSIWIDRFSKLLKPNGWLQWDELAWPPKVVVIPPQAGQNLTVKDFADHPMAIALAQHLNMDKKNGWFMNFESVINASGVFCGAKRVAPPIKPHLLKMETDSAVQVMTDCCNVCIERKGITDPTVLQQLRDAIKATHATRDAGMYFSSNAHVGIARKVTP